MEKMFYQHALDATKIIAIFIAILWAVETVNFFLFGNSLTSYGILPRTMIGLPGIILWPFLHANYYHLISNTTPLVVMGWFVALHGKDNFIKISSFISVLSGIMVWIFAFSSGFHVGASGLLCGYFGYLVANGIIKRNQMSVLISIFVIFFYGSSILFGLLPIFPGVSWEGHLFGLIAGVAAAYIFNDV